MTHAEMNVSVLPVAFRDTALTVAGLGQRAVPLSFDTLRQRCREQIARLRQELKEAGEPEDVIRDAMYAQCALLDEAALSHLTGQDRDAWEREPLQVAVFGTHDAGEALITRMQQRLQQPQPARPLLAIFAAVLALGFRGRFALEGAHARVEMMQALGARLGRPESAGNGVIVRSAGARRWLSGLSAPMWVLLSVAAAILVWFALDRWLAAAVAQLR